MHWLQEGSADAVHELGTRNARRRKSSVGKPLWVSHCDVGQARAVWVSHGGCMGYTRALPTHFVGHGTRAWVLGCLR